MGIIKNINLDLIENEVKKIVDLSFQLKLLQGLNEVIENQIKFNETSFSSGNISKDIYSKNKIILEVEGKDLTKKINESIENILKINNNLQENIKKNFV